MKWYFNKRRPDEIIRETHISEFFSDEEIENESEAIVREAIQNALDARIEKKANVRFFLSTDSKILSSDSWKFWFKEAWDHFKVEGNRLSKMPADVEECKFLVCEDFGTTGLVGDVGSWDDEGKDNHFMYFFRAEGKTGKSGSSGGRWGIGKHVFPRASRVNSFFGVTRRADDNNDYLMGRSILRVHTLDDERYKPDGTFGAKNPSDPLVKPIVDKQIIQRFKRDFFIARTNESGLSVVVPFVNNEVNCFDLVYSVILDYFYPVVKGELVVKVETEEKKIEINKDSIKSIITGYSNDFAEELEKYIELANYSQTCRFEDYYCISPNTNTRLRWDESLISNSDKDRMRNDLRLGNKIKIRIPVLIQVDGEKNKQSHFIVVMEKEGQDAKRPFFIRDGIIIKRVKIQKRPRGIRSLVVIEHRPLANLLGDSEGPAHLEWQTKSGNLPDYYLNGKDCIRYVSGAVQNILKTLAQDEEEKDLNLLIDIFSLDADDIEGGEVIEIGKEGDEEPEIVPPVPPTEKKKNNHSIRWIHGGFTVTKGEKAINFPCTMDIHVAYVTNSGKSLRKYEPADFKLQEAPIIFDKNLKDLNIKEIKDNKISVIITGEDFTISVRGFDQRRDLYIDVKVLEEEND